MLRKVAEDPTLEAAERNRAFVLIEEKFSGNFVQAELVKAFIQSAEYRKRFGQRLLPGIKPEVISLK